MINKVLRYIFIVAAVAVAVSVVLERRAFRSMLPQEYNFLERLGELELFRKESRPVQMGVPQPFVEPQVEELPSVQEEIIATEQAEQNEE